MRSAIVGALNLYNRVIPNHPNLVGCFPLLLRSVFLLLSSVFLPLGAAIETLNNISRMPSSSPSSIIASWQSALSAQPVLRKTIVIGAASPSCVVCAGQTAFSFIASWQSLHRVHHQASLHRGFCPCILCRSGLRRTHAASGTTLDNLG